MTENNVETGENEVILEPTEPAGDGSLDDIEDAGEGNDDPDDDDLADEDDDIPPGDDQPGTDLPTDEPVNG